MSESVCDSITPPRVPLIEKLELLDAEGRMRSGLATRAVGVVRRIEVRFRTPPGDRLDIAEGGFLAAGVDRLANLVSLSTHVSQELFSMNRFRTGRTEFSDKPRSMGPYSPAAAPYAHTKTVRFLCRKMRNARQDQGSTCTSQCLSGSAGGQDGAMSELACVVPGLGAAARAPDSAMVEARRFAAPVPTPAVPLAAAALLAALLVAAGGRRSSPS